MHSGKVSQSTFFLPNLLTNSEMPFCDKPWKKNKGYFMTIKLILVNESGITYFLQPLVSEVRQVKKDVL